MLVSMIPSYLHEGRTRQNRSTPEGPGWTDVMVLSLRVESPCDRTCGFIRSSTITTRWISKFPYGMTLQSANAHRHPSMKSKTETHDQVMRRGDDNM